MLIYLATPYSKYKHGPDAAHREACENAAVLIGSGLRVFCPIAHSHPIAHHGRLPKMDHDLWLGQDSSMMERCEIIVICQMEGWQDSYGVEWEKNQFREAGKPVLYMMPGSAALSVEPTMDGRG